MATPPASAHASDVPREAIREAITMALYLSLVLTAEFAAFGHAEPTTVTVLGVIWGSTVGLALAHVFAFDLTARLVNHGRVGSDRRAAAGFQLAAAAAIAAILSVPFLLTETTQAIDIAGYLAALLVGGSSYLAARRGGQTQLGALAVAGATLAIAAVVVGVKATLSH